MKIAVCDDQEDQVEQYTARLVELAKKHNISATFSRYSSGAALLFSLEDADVRPDLVYLDINMPGSNGITVAEKMREMRLPMEIVFLTVSQEHFYDAFDLAALNYLVKGQTMPERFEHVFLQAVKRVQDRQADTILLTCAGRNCNIRVRDITYFESQGKLMIVHYTLGSQKKKFEFYSSMEHLQEQLWGKGFVRTHRAYLVSTNYVSSIGYNTLQLLDGVELPVGRTYYRQAYEKIKGCNRVSA